MKKSLTLLTVILTLGLTLGSGEAEAAKRFGGGKTTGMQRQVAPMDKSPSSSPATPATSPSAAPSAAKAPAAAPAAQPKRSWMGPLAGLAAGLGLAALASHLGFGEEMASMLMIGLLVMAAVMAVGWFLRKRASAQPARAAGMQYAAAGPTLRDSTPEPFSQGASGGSGGGGSLIGANLATTPAIPADFDAAAFERQAKLNFLRLQAANDAGDLNDIRQFTSPELFAEIQLQLSERGTQAQQTRVLQVDASVLEVTQDNGQYIVSVRYTGSIQEDAGSPAEPFDEVWHLTKPLQSNAGWLVAGIQQA